MKGKSFFLLVVGDDGVLLVPPQRGKTVKTLFADSHDKAGAILEAIAASPRTPVLVLADTLAQVFRRDALPRLNFLDKRKLLKRRLQQHFPEPPHARHTQLTAALPLKNHAALLACLHDGGAAGLWFERLASLSTPPCSTALLPLESAPMVARLLPEARKGWGLMLSWQRTGGFRQIVTLDGELIFTRLTPPLPLTASPGFTTATLALDLQASLGYLARLGLTEGTPLYVIAVMPEKMHEALKTISLPLKSIVTVTPHQAAVQLGLPFGPAPDDPFGDLLHAAWLLGRPRPRVLLRQKRLQQTRNTSRLNRWGKNITAAVWLLALAAFGVEGYDLMQRALTLQQTATGIETLRQELAQERARLGPVTEPLGRLQKAIERRRLFATPEPQPCPVLRSLDKGLGSNARAVRIEWRPGAPGRPETLRTSLRLTGNAAPARAKGAMRQQTAQAFDALAVSLRAAMPDYDVTIGRYPFPALPNETLSNNDAKNKPAEHVFSLAADFTLTRTKP